MVPDRYMLVKSAAALTGSVHEPGWAMLQWNLGFEFSYEHVSKLCGAFGQ